MESQRRKLTFILRSCIVLLCVGTMLCPAAASPFPVKVPSPTSADSVYLFFNLINEHRVQEALSMMDALMVPDEAAAQAWAVSFNTIASIRVAELRRWESAAWSAARNSYKVILHITLKPDAACFGWKAESMSVG